MIDKSQLMTTPKISSSLAPATKKRIKTVAQSIESVKTDAQQVTQVSRKELEEIADRYARAPSAFLAGVVGGVLGTTGGIAVGTFAGALLVVTGPLGLALGAALGVLTFRGKNYLRLERETQKVGGAIDFLKGVSADLPKDAPTELLRNEVYEKIRLLVITYSRIAHDSMDNGPAERSC